MGKIKSICVFGGSIAWGAWDMEKGGWVNRLHLSVSKNKENNHILVHNLGVSGNDTNSILKRFEKEARVRKADGLIFLTGNNDSLYDQKTKKVRISLKNFEKNLEEIMVRGKKITDRIIFICPLNCDESKTMPVYWGPYCYTNDNLKEYSDVMRKICKKHKVLFLKLKALNKNEFDDGLHPNAKGHEKIFKQITGFLKKNMWLYYF